MCATVQCVCVMRLCDVCDVRDACDVHARVCGLACITLPAILVQVLIDEVDKAWNVLAQFRAGARKRTVVRVNHAVGRLHADTL